MTKLHPTTKALRVGLARGVKFHVRAGVRFPPAGRPHGSESVVAIDALVPADPHERARLIKRFRPAPSSDEQLRTRIAELILNDRDLQVEQLDEIPEGEVEVTIESLQARVRLLEAQLAEKQSGGRRKASTGE